MSLTVNKLEGDDDYFEFKYLDIFEIDVNIPFELIITLKNQHHSDLDPWTWDNPNDLCLNTKIGFLRYEDDEIAALGSLECKTDADGETLTISSFEEHIDLLKEITKF